MLLTIVIGKKEVKLDVNEINRIDNAPVYLVEETCPELLMLGGACSMRTAEHEYILIASHLLKCLSEIELKAVYYHELAHIKFEHSFVGNDIDKQTLYEHEADDYAVSFVGKEAMLSSLMKVKKIMTDMTFIIGKMLDIEPVTIAESLKQHFNLRVDYINSL